MACENGPGKPRVVRHDTAALRERFEAADLDHDGHLTRAEFNALRAEDYLRCSRAAAAAKPRTRTRPEGRGRPRGSRPEARARGAGGARRGDDETAAAAAALARSLPPSVTFDDIDVDGSGDISFDGSSRGSAAKHERADVLGGTARSAAPRAQVPPRRSRSCSRGGGRGCS